MQEKQTVNLYTLNNIYIYVSICELTTCHTRSVFQKLAASSTLNRVPPTGAPKAADTPEAAPAATKSRIS